MPVLVLAFLACTDDVPTLHVTTAVMTSVELSPPDDGVPEAFGHYQWDVSSSPDGVVIARPAAQTAAIIVTPPKRGLYVYERWFVGEATQQLSYHVIITVTGTSPIARIDGPSMVADGEVAMFDGTASSSTDLQIQSYQWRLALRPSASAATLADAAQPMITFVPDVAGQFELELRVFDGQLWSTPSSATLTVR